jgi:hypothetical protein
MNVYIKAFNRPFYLDRCLTSLARLASGVGAVVVLDDGTESRFKAALRARHPAVRWIESNADDGKMALLRAGAFEEIRRRYDDPARLWTRAIAAETAPRFLLLEEDTWLTEALDLAALDRVMAKLEVGFARLHWHLLTVQGERIVHRDVLGPDLTLDVVAGEPRRDPATGAVEEVDLYRLWQPALSAYRTDYFRHVFADVEHYADEAAQLHRALDWIRETLDRGPVRFARLGRPILFHGWAVPGRSDDAYYREGLPQHVYMDCLNAAWLAGRFDAMAPFPDDFGTAELAGLFESELGPAAASTWRRWRADYVERQAFPYRWFH